MITRTDLVDFWADLTRRERQVVEYMAQGLRNRDIAMNLAVGIPTVEYFQHRIYLKLRTHELCGDGASPRTMAIKIYTRLFLSRRTRIW